MENANINSWTELKDENSILLDVRTMEEFNSGHIEGAINIDVFSPNFQAEVEKLDKNKKYFVTCRSGGRSMSAAGAMDSMGFPNITNMAGGMMSWMGEMV